MKRRGRRWKFAVVGLLLAAAGMGVAYRVGWWIPNGWAAGAYTVRGVDVSHYQGRIDWKAVASEGIGFAYIKATEGSDWRDSYFVENWKQSAAQRIPRGAYHFFRLTASGKAQAENFLATVPVDPGAMPPVVDLELGGNSSDRPRVEALRAELDTLLSRLRQAYGKEPVLYTDEEFYRSYLVGYPIRRLWISSLIMRPPAFAASSWLFWQFTERGRVRGIETLVDIDVFAKDAAAFQAFLAERGNACFETMNRWSLLCCSLPRPMLWKVWWRRRGLRRFPMRI